MTTRLTVPISERDHVLGSPTAAVTLLEYGDYECPSCGMAHSVVKAIQRQLGRRLRFAYRHFPLTTVHPHALQAAEAAEVAGTQDRFWEMHDMLFEHQWALGDEDLVQYAAALGLDPIRFAGELASHVHAARVSDDVMSGVRSGVHGTPTFFIDGMRHEGSVDFDTLLDALVQAMEGATGARHRGAAH